MIAPAIITIDTGVDQNPKYMARLSKRKLDFLDVIYSNRILFATHDFLSKVKELILKKIGKTDAKPLSGTSIYAPHGAVFIFTDMEFLKKLPTFECFLFGEEIFIAEEAQTKNKKIIYEPSIIVND
ncbi:rhamnosyl transferase, partial [Photobacterium sp. CAIM 1938]|nr:rhamnosyl transferase [Photobacterium lucens]